MCVGEGDGQRFQSLKQRGHSVGTERKNHRDSAKGGGVGGGGRGEGGVPVKGGGRSRSLLYGINGYSVEEEEEEFLQGG